MYANPNTRAVVRHWQALLDEDVEAGADSLLTIGGGNYAAPNAHALYAIQLLTERRDDPAQPLMAAGGSGAQWPALLFMPQPLHTRPAAAVPVVLYGGDDPATGMACLGVWVDGLAASPYSRNLRLHYLFDPLLHPHSTPGITTTWEMLPFVVGSSAQKGTEDAAAFSGLRDDGVSGAGVPDGARESQFSRLDNSDDWIAWATLILALLLPLIAMIV